MFWRMAGLSTTSRIAQDYFCFLWTFGVEFGDACSTPEEAAKFGPAFDKANYLSVQRYVDVLWPIKKCLNIGSEATLKKCVEITDHVVYKLIERRAQEMRQSQDSTLAEVLAKSTYQERETGTASGAGIFNDDRSTVLSNIRWNDSLGPFDLALPY
ncbi:hypothetical protein Droror1_Dr00004940 [Drosera rotundifolia]